MKITAILGSPVRQGNTETMVQEFLKGFSGEDLDTVVLNELDFRGCQACNECKATEELHCALKDDLLPVMHRIAGSDLVVAASPVYMDQVTGQMKMFQDRLNLFLRSDFTSKLKKTDLVFLFSQGVEDPEAYGEYLGAVRRMLGKFGFRVLDTVIHSGAEGHDAAAGDAAVMDYLSHWRTEHIG